MKEFWKLETMSPPSPAMVFEVAHWSPMPAVNGAYATMGRGPVPVQALAGTTTVPLMGMGWFRWSRLRYMTRVEVALLYFEGCALMTSPFFPTGNGEGGV